MSQPSQQYRGVSNLIAPPLATDGRSRQRRSSNINYGTQKHGPSRVIARHGWRRLFIFVLTIVGSLWLFEKAARVDSFDLTIPVGSFPYSVAIYSNTNKIYAANLFSDNVAVINSAPANDNFAGATVISNSSGTIIDNNLGATKQAGEPIHAGDAGGASVWYKWQAPLSGKFTFTTFDSTFD